MSYLNDKLKDYPKLHLIYRSVHYVYLISIEHLPFWLILLKNSFRAGSGKTIFFYPEKPRFYHAIYQICRVAKIKTTDDPKDADAFFRFDDTTIGNQDQFLIKLSKKKKFINFGCTDISKNYIGLIHQKAFGYTLTIDPTKHNGKYVKKTNLNSLHDGVILDHPENKEAGFIYQKLVGNVVKGELLEMRVPVIGTSIPFVYLKHRTISNRFGSKSSKVEAVHPKKVFSNFEIRKIIKFCDLLGLNIGELDILRDNKNKKIYIVDANNTPASPPYNFSWVSYEKCLKSMSDEFIKKFFPQN